MTAENGNDIQRHNSVINRVAVRALIASEGFYSSEDLILTLEAKVNAMIRQGIRGLGGLSSKTVKGEHIERGGMRGDPKAKGMIDQLEISTSPRKVRRGVLG